MWPDRERKRLWLLKTPYGKIRKNKIASGCPTSNSLGFHRHFLFPKLGLFEENGVFNRHALITIAIAECRKIGFVFRRIP
jgi:hypothetical protein